MFPLSEFEGTTGSEVSVSFTLWKFGKPTLSKELPLNLMARSEAAVVSLGTVKTFYGLQNEFLNEWWKVDCTKSDMQVCPPLSNAMTLFKGKITASTLTKLPKGSIGYFHSGSPTIKENNQQVYILSSVRANGHGNALVNSSTGHGPLLKAFAAFFVRRSVLLPPSMMWKVGHINIRKPSADAMNTDFVTWSTNCSVFACFNSKSLQASMRKVGFENSVYHIYNEFFFLSREEMKELAEEANFKPLLFDLESHGKDERFMYRFLEEKKAVLFPESLKVLEKAKELWKASFSQRMKTPTIEIPKTGKLDLQLSCWDAGYYQIRALLKSASNPELDKRMQDLKSAVNNLQRRLWNGIFTFKFLSNGLQSILCHPLTKEYVKLFENLEKQRKTKKNITDSKFFSRSQDDGLSLQLKKLAIGVDQWERISISGVGDCGHVALSLSLVRSGQHLMSIRPGDWIENNDEFNDVLSNCKEDEITALEMIAIIVEKGKWTGLDFFRIASKVIRKTIYVLNSKSLASFGIEYVEDEAILIASNACDATNGVHFDPLFPPLENIIPFVKPKETESKELTRGIEF